MGKKPEIDSKAARQREKITQNENNQENNVMNMTAQGEGSDGLGGVQGITTVTMEKTNAVPLKVEPAKVSGFIHPNTPACSHSSHRAK